MTPESSDSSDAAESDSTAAQRASDSTNATNAREPSVPEALVGTFVYTSSAEHAQAIAMRAAEPRIEALPFLAHGIARSRLRERLPLPNRITVSADGDRVHLIHTGNRALDIESALDRSFLYRNEEGEEVRAVQRIHHGRLEQILRGPDGTMRFVLSSQAPDAPVYLYVTVESERLDAPIRYRLEFRRQS